MRLVNQHDGHYMKLVDEVALRRNLPGVSDDLCLQRLSLIQYSADHLLCSIHAHLELRSAAHCCSFPEPVCQVLWQVLLQHESEGVQVLQL